MSAPAIIMIPDELNAFVAGISFTMAAWAMCDKRPGLAIFNLVAFGINVVGALI